jgi:hypothetical protein
MSEFPGHDPGFNLPWGAKNASNAPWNQDGPEEPTWDDLCEQAEEHEGDLYFEEDESDTPCWTVELPDGTWLPVETKEECVLLLVFDREQWLTEQIDERLREEEFDRAYDVMSGE